MPKKKKRGFFDDFFGDFGDIFDFAGEGGFGGYSIEVRSTPEGTEVHAHVYGNVDVEKLKRKLESMYPGAKIVIEGEGVEEKPLIRRIDEEEAKEEERRIEEPREGVSITFKEGKPIIIRHGVEKIIREEEKKERKAEKLGVEITFRKGKPIIKRIE